MRSGKDRLGDENGRRTKNVWRCQRREDREWSDRMESGGPIKLPVPAARVPVLRNRSGRGMIIDSSHIDKHIGIMVVGVKPALSVWTAVAEKPFVDRSQGRHSHARRTWLSHICMANRSYPRAIPQPTEGSLEDLKTVTEVGRFVTHPP